MDSVSDEEKIVEFCQITGDNRRRAQFLLGACNYDLQTAINYHLEARSDLREMEPLMEFITGDVYHPPLGEASTSRSSCTSVPGPSTSSQDSSADDLQACLLPIPMYCGTEIPDPILPKEDILIDSSAALALNRKAVKASKRGHNSIFDSFRDFRVEGNQQEELLQNSSTHEDKKKIRRLEDIFRPPLELMYHGSFEKVRDAGMLHHKFLLVNIQNTTEFSCQVLNRDIWSDSVVKMIVKENFLFWQVFYDTREGSAYTTFYNVDAFPYVSIIDPRTGELVHRLVDFTLSAVVDELLRFIQENPFPFPPTDPYFQKEQAAQKQPSNGATEYNPDAWNLPSNGMQPMEGVDGEDEGEKERLRPEAGESLSDSSEEVGRRSVASLQDETDPLTRCGKLVHIRLQYPDQSRELLTFPVSGKLSLMHSFLKRKGYPPDKFQYVTYMPKRALNKQNVRRVTFQSLDMVHKECVYVHPITHEDDKI